MYIFNQNLKSHIFSCMDKIPFVCKKFLWNINLVEKMYGNLSWRHSFIGQKSAWKRRACNTMFKSTGSHNHEITFSTRSGRDSMIVKIINFSVFLSSIILPANCSLLNFCSKPQIHWGFLHELFKLKEDDCLPLPNSFTM